LLEITESEKDAITGQVKLADSGALGRILEVLTDCEMRLRDASSKKILVEVSLLKAIQASNAMSLNEVLDKLQELRGSASPQPARVPAPKTTSKAPVQQKPEPVASKQTTDSPAGNLVELWPQLVRVAGEMQPFAVGYLTEAHPVLLDEKHLTIGFAPEFSDQMELADNPTFNQTLQKALAKLGHADVEVKFVKAERPAAWLGAPTPIEAPAGQEIAAPAETKKTKPAGGPIDMEEFKNDPLIKKALEVFKGQIVDVRSP
jgi:DNA polymerase-3 subunit gamma/tau